MRFKKSEIINVVLKLFFLHEKQLKTQLSCLRVSESASLWAHATRKKYDEALQAEINLIRSMWFGIS